MKKITGVLFVLVLMSCGTETKLCKINDTRSCSCIGHTGVQTCKNDETGWDICVCCEPDSKTDCTCSTGNDGVKICASDGSSYGVCQCKICTPKTTNSCTCPDNSTGTQTCNDSGIGFDICKCCNAGDKKEGCINKTLGIPGWQICKPDGNGFGIDCLICNSNEYIGPCECRNGGTENDYFCDAVGTGFTSCGCYFCVPNETISCYCGSKTGTKTCNSSGTDWTGPCSCPCKDTETQSCTCPNGASGTQTCSNGSFGVCNCGGPKGAWYRKCDCWGLLSEPCDGSVITNNLNCDSGKDVLVCCFDMPCPKGGYAYGNRCM
jgi:hypothetical protein